ncbi:E3 ubiquitin-protein ligase rnf146-like [Xyrauchen texanus]|uniref:E3 ubiquitin-protein ligase rnf146-like n=1 Tax=Xyrauchen texanus TaxID=154827 RepID=UPI0022427738|nr:E3 ubiquitin-protein ligase rnf146-like [Xyrauchen texanus]
MASCSEVNVSVDTLTSGKKVSADSLTDGSPSPLSPSLPVPECAICLQSCVHPVRLPCRHIFCFLCVKGASWHSKRCALCRQEVPEDFLERPTLLSPEELKASATGGRGAGAGGHAWYYEGRNGWWQYDERTSRELEDAFNKGKKSAEMLIAGFLYVADLENMVQYRRNEHGRRRRMKRDVVDIPKKGVAGLRLDPDPSPVVGSGSVTVTVGDAAVADLSASVDGAAVERESSADGADTSANSGRPQGVFAPPPIRPSTVLGGHLTGPAGSSSGIQLVQALAQLNINPVEPGLDEEDIDDEDDSVIPDASGYESESSTSEEDDESIGGEGALEGAESSRGRHRLQQLDRPPPGGGPAHGSDRSGCPDGQCTVTKV